MRFSTLLLLPMGLLHSYYTAQAQAVISPQSLQLQQLIEKSEEQIESLREMLKYEKRDSESIKNVSVMLQRLSSGIDESIEKFQGTEAFSKALIDLQSKSDFKKTYSDSMEIRERNRPAIEKNGQGTSVKNDFDDVISFQKRSVQANNSDLSRQSVLQKALQTAQPGLVPKIQVEAQLGSWQASTRVSAQLTELLSAIHAMREELRSMRMKDENSNILQLLVNGSKMQSEKLQQAPRK